MTTITALFAGVVKSSITAALFCVLPVATVARSDPLPSWNDGKTKQSILTFVSKATKEGSPEFSPPAQRIATTFAGGVKSLVQIVCAGNTNITPDEFDQIVKSWAASAKHPQTGRLYTEMVHQPMLEVLAHLRANGFKTYITSGGGADFMRAFSERVYGIAPERVIGSVDEVKLADAAVDMRWLWHALLPLCSPYGRRARVGLRRDGTWPSRKGPGRSHGQRLDHFDMKDGWKIIYPFERKEHTAAGEVERVK